MTQVDGPWRRHAETQAFLAALARAGHRGLFVGGCVRDAVLGRPVGDVDIATDAVPPAVERIAAAAGFRTVPTGIDHGTVTVLADDVPLEVTTFRRDVETDGRHAEVAFSDRLEEDAARRDFTMNALYADAGGALRDPTGGLDDLRAGRVRFIGAASDRIAEDYLRILRFFRFHAWYGDPAEGIDAEGLAACAAGAEGLDRLSAERVGHEMRRLLAAPDPGPAVAAMQASGVLARILPGADPAPLPRLVAVEAAADPLARLAALGGEDAADRLRLSRAEARTLDLYRAGLSGTQGTAELAWRHGPEAARTIEALRAAVFAAPLPATLDEDIAQGAAATFPVSARDLMPDVEGAALGARLKALEAAWIASGLTATREDLLALPQR
ncbi:CCA tRNA nucleotidyltransferase [Rhodobacteraceae bacterium CCMM004]|nr:CCA tRNA nucleotidyltransferase [Rhodobacteraceae bacterium CCMM004]